MTDHESGSVDISRCLHPTERSRYWLAVATLIPIVGGYIYLTQMFGLLVIPVLLLGSWFSTKIARAQLLGSCVEVTRENFPEIGNLLSDVCDRIDFHPRMEAYVYQDGDVNAFLMRHFRTRMILLPHGLVEGTLNEQNRAQLKWVLARFVGHLKAKHLRLFWLKVLIEAFEKLLILNIFLYPWERATQYSGDRIGVAVCGDLDQAIVALRKLMIGNALAEHSTILGSLQQRRNICNSAFAWLAQALSSHPHLTNRIGSLIEWTKTHDASAYAGFIVKQPDRERIEKALSTKRSFWLPLKIIALVAIPMSGIALPAVLLPSLSRAREQARRVLCQSHLRSIGMSIQIYAAEGNGDFPDDIATLVTNGSLNESQFLCRSSESTLGDLEACYVYIRGQGDWIPPENVIMYEKPKCHGGEGGSVLFGDTHVEFVRTDELNEKVRLTRLRVAKRSK